MDRIQTEAQSPRPASPTTTAEADEAAPDAPVYAPVRTHTNSRSIGRRRSSLSGSMRRTRTTESVKETRDPNLDINLPYRTLTATANLAEYTTEEPAGSIVGPLEPDGEHRYKLVTFVPGDPENPKNWSKAYKWYCTMVVAITCFVVAFASSVITADLEDVSKEFNVSEEVSLVTITVFVVGFGVGPMIFAPLSEIFGRRII